LLLAVGGSVIAQDSGQVVEKWELKASEDRLTHDKTSWSQTDVSGDVGHRFHLQAACIGHSALNLFVSADAKLAADCEKARILIDGKLVGRGRFMCDQTNGVDRFIFLGDLTDAFNQTAGLYGSVLSAVATDGKSKEVVEEVQKALQSPNPLTQASNQFILNAFRGLGLAMMSDIANAKSVRVEMPFVNGDSSILDIHPQELTFKNYVVGCAPPVPAPSEQPSSRPAAGPTSGDAISSTIQGPAEKSAARTYRGDLDGFIAALPGYLQRAAAGVGAPERSYSDEIAYIAAATKRCASISPQAAASVTFYGRVDTSKLGEPYRICSSTYGTGVPGPVGKSPELFLGIHPRKTWGDGNGMTINVAYTEAGYPGSNSGTAPKDYGIVTAVIGGSESSPPMSDLPSGPEIEAGNITLTRANPSGSGQATITAPGRGLQNYNFVRIDTRDFANGGTLVIDIRIPSNSGTDGSFDLFSGNGVSQGIAPSAKSLAGSYDVRRGSQARLKYRFQSGQVFALNLEGNWFSPKGATGVIHFQASVLQ
jgi:hypothetical protein